MIGGDLESTAMTVIALDTLGVNADSDGRFVAKKRQCGRRLNAVSAKRRWIFDR